MRSHDALLALVATNAHEGAERVPSEVLTLTCPDGAVGGEVLASDAVTVQFKGAVAVAPATHLTVVLEARSGDTTEA